MFVSSLVLTLLLFSNTGYSEYLTRKTSKGYGSRSNEFPAVVSIHRLTYIGKSIPFCAGTIIHRKAVITVAHCVVLNNVIIINGTFVYSGAENLKYSAINKIVSVYVHPNYNDTTLTDDIAIVTIEGSFPDWIIPIKLSKEKDGYFQSNCTVVEWGDRYLHAYLKYSDSFYNFKLNSQEEEVLMSVTDFDCSLNCEQKKFPVSEGKFKDNNINWLHGTEYRKVQEDKRQFIISDNCITCCHDLYNGPVICGGVLYGIVSWGNRIRNGQRPNSCLAVAIRVSYYIDWIEDIYTKIEMKYSKTPDGTIKPEVQKKDEFLQGVSLSRVTIEGKLVPYCGGTVIHRYIVLTAGSCVTDDKGNLDITGVHVMSGSTDLRFSKIHKTVKGVLHSEYNKSIHTNDIALISVDRPFDGVIIPVKLADYSSMIDILGTQCKVFGWGFENPNKSLIPFKYNITTQESDSITRGNFDCGFRCIQQSISVNPLNDCHDYAGVVTNDTRTLEKSSKFCTSSRVYDRHHGQPGNPIICSGIQYGIVSWGSNSEMKIINSVANTGVRYYSEWIKKAMNSL